MPTLVTALRRFERFYLGLPIVLSGGGLLGFIFLLTWLDYVTGRALNLSLLYALVCGLVGWARGRRAVLVTATLCVASAFTTDLLVDSSAPLHVDLINQCSRWILWSLLGATMASLRARLNELDVAYEGIRTDMAAAQRVQLAFLSKVAPVDPRFELDVKFRTARLLGGDFFTVKLMDSELHVFITDVSGKGAPAALVTGLISGVYAEISHQHARPSEVLTLLDHRIRGFLPTEMFATAFYIILDLERGVARYASAGHDPQLLWNDETGLKELLPTGLPLGLLDGFELTQEELTLKSNDLLVLFTDGLLNARLKNGGRLGEEAVYGLIREHSRERPELIIKSVFSSVDERAEFDDDVVVMGLRISV
jgi:serine phosphatase RsbU (regulator of sigma subunit)